MKKYNLLLLFLMLGSLAYGQVTTNLLPVEDWTEGTGSVSTFLANGPAAESVRTIGIDPHDESSVIWTCTAPGNSGADGGWNAYFDIDDTKTYRFAVWVRRNTSNSGSTYLGANNAGGNTLNLNGTVNNNPYFWSGDLPEIGKWYLMVGYVHSSNYTGTESYGGIYDGETGEKVINMTDFRSAIGATQQRHRAYYFYSTDPSVQTQDFWGPRAEAVEGNEPTIEALLGINNVDDLSGNLLPVEDWEIGSGSNSIFNQYGLETENERILDVSPHNETAMIWRGTSSGNGSVDGGWYADFPVDPKNTYRYTSWMRKRSSEDGTTYFGAGGNIPVLKLDGTPNSNPYFWSGDLPELDKWYLLVGYVHSEDYTGTENYSAVYDGETGEKVFSGVDYRSSPDMETQRHRVLLWNSATAGAVQDHWGARAEAITGNEPTIQALLSINDSDDVSGNLLPIEEWNVGEGTTPSFDIYSTPSENVRVNDVDPHGESSIIWRTVRDANGNGGWRTDYPVDNAKSYRLSAWVKRNDSDNGTTYFGAGYNKGLLKMDGSPDNNPIFMNTDLPEIDKWYLMVGYVHGLDYAGTTSIGGVYDGITGEKVMELTDFKNGPTTTQGEHRLLHFGVTIAGESQDQWGARAEAVDGNEPTIEALLGIPKEFIWSEITDGAVYNDGSVGIGVDENDMDTDYKLLVDGDIKSRKVKVTLDGWADYVFEKDYNLLPLAQVEEFININGHLPEVPNTATVLEEGIFLGDTDVLLLKKIEELTLYIIQLEKKVNQLEQEVSKQ